VPESIGKRNINVLDIATDEIRARDGDGLKLYDDGGNGIFIEDGGNIGIGTVEPKTKLHVSGGVASYDDDRNLTSLRHLVDRKYVDIAVTALGLRYYMLDTDSGTEDYKNCSSSSSDGAEQSSSKASLSDDDYILGWIAPNANEPDKLIIGEYNWRIYAEKTGGTKTLRLYWKLVERKSDTSEVVIGTSIISNDITSGKNSYILPLTLSADYDIASDSYVVGKIYADVSGSGSAPSVTLYYEGDSDSHWQIPVNTEILDGIYVNIDGDTMTGDLTVSNLYVPDGGFVGISGADGWTFDSSNGDISTTSNVGIGTTEPTAALDINSDILRLRTAKTPASSGDTGNAGDVCWDADYLYICTATNTWRRIQHATW